MYIEMNPIMQLYNTFRNRWVGAYLVSNGIKVTPTVNWGLENTFDFCFNGIEKGSIVAVSTYMVSEHGNHCDQKEFFMKGYNELIRRIEPKLVICYHEPFPEMEGNILYVNYELSSWRHYNEDECKEASVHVPCLITKRGYVQNYSLKGSGSAYGGKWKPKNPDDKRFVGKAGEIIETTKRTSQGSYTILTKIGDDGLAVLERHFTDHGYPKMHSNPHDHIISWDPQTGFPNLHHNVANYWNGNIPNLKSKGAIKMNGRNYPDCNSFDSLSDFKWCIIHGGEIEFVWKEKTYSIIYHDGKIYISQIYCPETEKTYDDIDSLLEHRLETGETLKEIILDAAITDRTL